MDQPRLVELGVLGLLAEERATLEGLKERFNHNFGRYQFAGHGTLDPAVERLADAGRVAGTGTYHITDQGEERLDELLREPVEAVHDPAHRPHLLLKLGFLHHLPEDAQRDALAALEDRFHETLSTWRDIATAHDEGVDHVGYRRELFDLQISLLATQREWVASLRESLDE